MCLDFMSYPNPIYRNKFATTLSVKKHYSKPGNFKTKLNIPFLVPKASLNYGIFLKTDFPTLQILVHLFIFLPILSNSLSQTLCVLVSQLYQLPDSK